MKPKRRRVEVIMPIRTRQKMITIVILNNGSTRTYVTQRRWAELLDDLFCGALHDSDVAFLESWGKPRQTSTTFAD